MGELRFSVSLILLYSNYTEYSFCDIHIYPHAGCIEQPKTPPTGILSAVLAIKI